MHEWARIRTIEMKKQAANHFSLAHSQLSHQRKTVGNLMKLQLTYLDSHWIKLMPEW
jgi:hypothetical protein